MKSILLFFLVAFGIGVAAGDVQAQGMPEILKYASVTVTSVPTSVHAGGTLRLKAVISIKSGFHINSNRPNDPDLIPTVVSVGSGTDFKGETVSYPTSKTISAPSLSQKPLSVFVGTTIVFVKVILSHSAKPGRLQIPITVSYQGCNSNSCYPPTSTTLTATVSID